MRGVRPGYDPLVDDLPRLSTPGWQHFASEAVVAQTGRSASGFDAIATRPHGWDPIHVHAAL